MNGWLLDTILFKYLGPGSVRRSPSFQAWVAANAEPIFLSAVSVVEINARIQKAREADRAALQAWLKNLVTHYHDRIHPVDAEVAARAGALIKPCEISKGWLLCDALLAATAQIHGHGLLTERKSAFAPWTPIELWDPFEQGLPGKPG